jgi:hypothetical protein
LHRGAQEELANNLGHLGEEEIAEVKRGLWVAYDAHDGQKRKSGEPYIIHPVAVARILADLHLDRESIIAGLLHDTVRRLVRVSAWPSLRTRMISDRGGSKAHGVAVQLATSHALACRGARERGRP